MENIIPQNLDLYRIPSTPGIYAIVNTVNQQMYIGSAKDLKQRAHIHLHRLAVGNHPNKHLRRASSIYGPDAFRFEVLELVEHAGNLLAREQHHINVLKPQYNMTRLASRNLGMMIRRHQPANLQPEIRTGTAMDIQSNMQIWAKMSILLGKTGLADSEKTMIATLLASADANGIKVSLTKLMKYTGYSERQVCNILKSLKEKGLIRVITTFRDDGAQQANTYDLSPLYQKVEH